MRNKHSILLCAFISITFSSFAQIRGDIFADNYTSNQDWIQINSGISIKNGVVMSEHAQADLTQNRIYKQIPNTIKSNDNWMIETEFTDQATNNEYPSYDLIALTPDIGDVRMVCTSGSSCTSTTNSNKNLYINCGKIAGTSDMILYAGITNDMASEAFHISSGITYYLKLEKTDSLYTFSVFSDEKHENQIDGSPKTFKSRAVLPNYMYVQHAVSTAGGSFRRSTFTLDNTWISSIPKVVDAIDYTYNLYETNFLLMPNPASSSLVIKTACTDVQEITVQNVWGTTIYSSKYQSEINVSNFPKGTYIVNMRCNNNLYKEKLVIE